MSQSDFGTIDPNTKSGPTLATDLNTWRDALHSSHKGGSAPSYAAAGTVWLDDTSNPFEAQFLPHEFCTMKPLAV